MPSIISIKGLTKTYPGGFKALDGVDLEIEEGEILALLGPNGAGKTTLISTICGIANKSGGKITVGGFDVVNDYRETRRMIGLVPQEINLEIYSKVIDCLRFSRGLFGKPQDDAYLDSVIDSLSLTDKREAKTLELSGGMRRRVLIAKALAHDPRVLFLDEPTAGVDVELRKSMWDTVAKLKARGVTIILTTHYIEEAEAIADRIAVINKGKILLVEDKASLMARMGQKELTIELSEPLEKLPKALAPFNLELGEDGRTLRYLYDTRGERTGITALLQALQKAGVGLADMSTRQSSLEDIFVGLVKDQEDAA